ncbi:MAG: nucleotidyltransferase family protein, partial [Roseburia sp.]|nr:nucleotidyltransferase family protein [Roseburia sp.]
GILALHSLSFVDYFCFGSEGADETALKEAGQFFAEEPDAYKEKLKGFLKTGMSYPAARERAYAETTGVEASVCQTLFLPNNILGAGYIRAAAMLNTHMKPVVVRRRGRGYHDTCREHVREDEFLSAAAIREGLKAGECSGVPEEAEQELRKADCFLGAEDFWQACSYAIRDRWEKLEEIKDVSAELAGAFRKNWYEALSMKDFTEMCKTKNVTMSRVKRCVFQTLLGLEKEAQPERSCPYIRLLGMKKEAAEKFRGADGTVILGRLAKDMEKLSDEDKRKVHQDIKASDLYRSTAMRKSGRIQPEEYKRPVIVM